jgi:PAAR motif.
MPPDARVGDMHTCPMVTVLVPHVGGLVLPPGCPTVMIEFMPVARLGDTTAHGGVIVMGAPTVMIGG